MKAANSTTNTTGTTTSGIKTEVFGNFGDIRPVAPPTRRVAVDCASEIASELLVTSEFSRELED